ncbi:MAG: hypothetical protein M1823_006415, partial [Watsoniomyces obsoletus]
GDAVEASGPLGVRDENASRQGDAVEASGPLGVRDESASRQGDAVEASRPLGVKDEQDGHEEELAAWATPQRDDGDAPVFQIAGVRAKCRLLPKEVWAYALATEGA